MENKNYEKSMKYTDRKIIWRLVEDGETYTDYKNVAEFLPVIEDNTKIRIIVDHIISIVTNNSIHDDLRDEIIKLNDTQELGLDIDFARKYQSYGLSRDKLKLIVKFKNIK